MKRKTADIASFFSKGAVRKKQPAEAQNDRQGEQIEETDSESEREEPPLPSGPRGPPSILQCFLYHCTGLVGRQAKETCRKPQKSIC